MKFIYELVGNWGWAIILLTVVIKFFSTPFCGQPAFHGKNAQPAAKNGEPEGSLWG